MSWKPKTGDLVAFTNRYGCAFGLLYYLSDEDWYVDWGEVYPRSQPRVFDYSTLASWRNQYEKLLQDEGIVV